MVKKEFLALLKPTLQRFTLLLMIPFAYILNASGITPAMSAKILPPFLLGIYMCVVVWVTANFGLDVFKEEHTDRAFEYLFTFPLRREKIILTKLWPRMVVISGLTCLLVLFWQMVSSYRFLGLEGFWFLVLWIFLMNQFFLGGYFISYVFSKPLRLGLFILTICSFGLFVAIGERLVQNLDEPNGYMIFINIIALMVILIMELIHRWSMPRFDLRTVEAYSKSFALRLTVIFVSIDCIGIFLILR